MTATKDILNVSQSMQALAIAGDSIKFANKKKKSTGDFLKQGTKTLVGTSLLKANAEFLGGID